jgi:hypothetical protein
MKYISIDLETTGLEKDRYEILSFGAIIEDTENKLPLSEIPKFHAAILHSELTGSPFAFNMNKKIIEAIVQYQTAKDQDEKNDLVQMTGMHFYHEDEVVEGFYRWLYDNGMVEVDPNFLNQQIVRLGNGKIYPAITSKTKQLKTELITLVVDLGLGLLVILFTGFTYEIIVLSLSLLYLLYYSYVMTISYTRLGHNTEEMLRDLSHRHENQNKKEK